MTMRKHALVVSVMLCGLSAAGERIVFVGDSITGQSRNHSEGFARQLDAAYEGTVEESSLRPTVVSLGGSGQTVESWKNVELNSRTDSEMTLDIAGVYVGENLDQHADRLVVMLGMNNVLQPTTHDTSDSLATYRRNYHELVTNLVVRATPDDIYLASVPPCTEDPEGPKNALIAKLNAEIRALVEELADDETCAGRALHYVPVFENQTNLLAVGRILSPACHVTGDKVHPNGIGHVQIAHSFLTAFGHADAAAWLQANRLQPKLDSLAADNESGLSYALVPVGEGEVGAFAFTVRANWVTRADETAPASVAFELELPAGWTETSAAVVQGLAAVFSVEGPLELSATPLTVRATPSEGSARSVIVSVPAPWRVSTPVAVNWSNSSGSWVYDREGAAGATETAIEANTGFAAIEAADPDRTPAWHNLFPSVDYVGGADYRSLDFSAISAYPVFGTAYALRYVYAARATEATLNLSSTAFAATLDTEIWLNGESVLVAAGTEASARVRLKAGNNLLAVRSSHTTWQWQAAVELKADDTSLDLRYGLRPLAEEAVEDATECPPEQFLLDDGSLVYVFSSNGTFQVTGTEKVEVLVVGGGGGGGFYAGGGGGGGEVIYRQSVELAAGDYPVVVGAGGLGSTTNRLSAWCPAQSGGASSAFGLTARGGGYGGGAYADNGSGGYKSVWTGGDGASGGGAGGNNTVFGQGAIDLGDGQMNDGAPGATPASNVYAGGGGGGAAGKGWQAVAATEVSAACYATGGVGVACCITGVEKWYGGGGGGGASFTDKAKIAPGGLGGGGAGGRMDGSCNQATRGEDGEPGTGGGGGGAGRFFMHQMDANLKPDYRGGNGGSGVVIVRTFPEYRTRVACQQGGEIARRGAYYVHTFASNGCFTVSQPIVIDALIVGGGGAGGRVGSTGGGGAGGVVIKKSVRLPPGEYPVIVGAGGVSTTNESGSVVAELTDGGPSSFHLYTALGGGGGATPRAAGRPGASGGGASSRPTEGYAGGAALQGHAGGSSAVGTEIVTANWNGCYGGGGGGGAGAPGEDCYLFGDSGNLIHPGRGGDGVSCDFSGEEKWYGGGGGGGAMNWGGTLEMVKTGGGKGGGGYGTGYNSGNNRGHQPGDGEPGTGGGGGGVGCCGTNPSPLGGSGGSGIVIIRYLREQRGALLRLR
ncbi:MAG: SGNH/GDSL hydrolase family protein [Kiritimatiellia bacterium]